MCLHNAQLRIKRVAKFWSVVAPGVINLEDRNQVTAHHISIAVGQRTAEALQLPSPGIPKESFTLVFDGEPFAE